MHCVCAWPRRGYKWAAQTAAFLCVVLRTELLSSAGLLGGHLARSRPTFLPTPPARPAVRVSGPLPAFLPGGSRGLPEAEGSSAALQRSKIRSAMKHMLNLYLLGVVLTLLSIFIRLIESLGGLLESPSPGNFWTTRGHLASTASPRAFQNIHAEDCDKTSLHRL